jgi:hypothetical protein
VSVQVARSGAQPEHFKSHISDFKIREFLRAPRSVVGRGYFAPLPYLRALALAITGGRDYDPVALRFIPSTILKED